MKLPITALLSLILSILPSCIVSAQDMEKMAKGMVHAFERSDFDAMRSIIKSMQLAGRMQCILKRFLLRTLKGLESQCSKRTCEDPFKGLVQFYGNAESRNSILISVQPYPDEGPVYPRPCRNSPGIRPEFVTIDNYQAVISAHRGKFDNEIGACISFPGGDLYISLQLPGDGTADDEEPKLRKELIEISQSIDLKKVASSFHDTECRI
jgi:hypothetical protein